MKESSIKMEEVYNQINTTVNTLKVNLKLFINMLVIFRSSSINVSTSIKIKLEFDNRTK